MTLEERERPERETRDERRETRDERDGGGGGGRFDFPPWGGNVFLTLVSLLVFITTKRVSLYDDDDDVLLKTKQKRMRD